VEPRNFPLRAHRVSASISGVPYPRTSINEHSQGKFRPANLLDTSDGRSISQLELNRKNRLEIQKEILERQAKIFNGRHDNANNFRDIGEARS